MTTIRINLLPHREIRRALQHKMLLAVAGAVVAGGLGIVVAGHVMITDLQDEQNQRNTLLKDETAKLDAQIKEIAKLREKTNALLGRKKVVESLQGNRSDLVHLFDDLARRMPEGVHLKTLKQRDKRLSLQGYAQASGQVSALMRNLDDSPRFDTPLLVEVKAVVQNKARLHEFSLEVGLSEATATESKAGAQDARTH